MPRRPFPTARWTLDYSLMPHRRRRSRRHLVAPRRRLRTARAALMQRHAMRCDAMRWHVTWALEPARSSWSRGRLTTNTRLVSLPAEPCSARSVATVARAAFVHLHLAASLRHRHSGASSQWIAIRLPRAASQRYTRALFPALGAGFGFHCRCCFTAHRASHSFRGACLPRSRNEDSILPTTPAVQRGRTESYRHSCALLLTLRLTPAALRTQAWPLQLLVALFQSCPQPSPT